MNQMDQLKEQFERAVEEKMEEVKSKSKTYKEARTLLDTQYFKFMGKLESLVSAEARQRLFQEAENASIPK